ncbi:MAG: UpxY family transcription antiterminator [Chitinophagaceae bacterium]
MSEEQKWFVIVTRPRAEKKVSEGLSKTGIIHLLLMQKQLRQWKDRKKWVEMPLFNSYIFVLINPLHRNEVFDVPGVIKFVSIGGKPSTISEVEIDRIKRVAAFEKEITIVRNVLNIGDRVEVIEGPLKGIKGKLVEKENNAYLNIIIENLGYTASFKIDRSIVRRIAN